jgi:4-hydroxybenzoate polyprenyltransferase
MVKLIIVFVIIAAVATLLGAGAAFVINFWPYIIGAGAAVFGIYYYIKKQKDEGNKV